MKSVRCDAVKPPKLEITQEPWNEEDTPFSFFSLREGQYLFDYMLFNGITTLYVPKGSVALYKAAPGWSLFDNIVEQEP